MQELQYEQFGDDESYYSEGEDEDIDKMGDDDSGNEIVQHDNEGLDVINNKASEVDEPGDDFDVDIKDLYSGVQSLIQGD